MRTSSVRTVARATGLLAHDASALRAPRTPYICSSCQASQNIQSTPSRQHQRTFAHTPLRRAQDSSQQQPQTHYDFFPQTFPSGPPPQTPFTPDLKSLRKEFLSLQAKAHPDLVPSDQKRQAEALSARINEAYKTLQDPLKRAQYLLAQFHGIDVEDESAKLSENSLLMEVMEAREAVEEVEEEEELVGLREENNGRIEASVKTLDEAFGKGDLERAAQEAIRLRYWMNIEESIQGWEKGKGGGILHH